MKTTAQNILITLLCLVMSLMLFSAAFAEREYVQVYDTSFITGFESADYEQTINTEYKYALIVLSEQFPAQLTLRLGGTVHYQEGEKGSRILMDVENYTVHTADVVWKCLEDYDEDLDVFHFVPDFREYKAAGSLELPVITVNVLGMLPVPPLPPISEEMMPSIPVSQERLAEKSVPPSSYNGYELGNLPEIRNQNPYGTCWAFSTIAAVEADLIHDGNANTGIDLSELHLAYFTYHEYFDEKGLNTGDTISIAEGVDYLDYGGNNYKATFALFNMLGPVQESSVPYSRAAEYSPDPSEGRAGDFQIEGFYLYDITENRDSVKNAIMNHGAVTAAYNSNWNYYSSTYNSYYYPVSSGTNHVISVVGWDDNFSRDHFRSGTPEGDGAWLIRNSWGVNDYNYGGYFWMSYYDNSLYQVSFGLDVRPGRYEHIYSYDNCPGISGWSVSPDGIVKQTFIVDEGEQIQAIGIYTLYSNMGLSFTVSSGSSKVTQSFTTADRGYYLIPLSNPLTISQKSKVTVEYSFTGVDSESKYAYSEGSSYGSSDGIIYYAGTGSEGMVVDDYNTGFDGKIKLFTNKAPLASSVTIQNASGTDITGQTVTSNDTVYQLKAAAVPEGAVQNFTWTSSDTSIASVDSTGKVTFQKAGTVTITAAVTDGSGKSASVTVTADIKATKVVIKNSSGKNITGKTTKVTKKTYQLKAAVNPTEFASQKVTWKSSNTKIATVKNGKVTFKKAGKVKITATATDGSGKSASVTLKTAIKATKVTIRNTKGKAISHKTLKVKTKTIQVKALALPKKFAAQKFTWKTSDTKIATVKAGKVTFKKAGTVKIIATAKDGSKKSNWVKITYKP